MKGKAYEIKDTAAGSASVVDVDDASRRVKVVMNKMGVLDLDNDVIDVKAFNRTIKQRGPVGGENLIWHLTDHMPMMKNAIGKPSQILVDKDELVFITDIPKTTWGSDMLEMYKTGVINQHSIGFRTLQSQPMEAGTPKEYRLITEVMLYEGSAVLWGANPQTGTRSVGEKSLTKEDRDKKYFDTLKEVNNLVKIFRTGTVSDNTFELLEMGLVQKMDQLQQLYNETTQPAPSQAPAPVSESLVDVLKTFNHSLIIENESRRIKATA
jgi:HK97 family phage prohead protease